MRDLLGRQPAYFAQRERYLCICRKRRVAAGEDETQPVVLDAVVVGQVSGSASGIELRGQRRDRCVAPRTPA